MDLAVGDNIELEILKVENKGKAVAKKDSFVFFVNQGVPGQKILAEITRVKRRHAEAKLLEVIEDIPDAIKPECPYFGKCGGCSWQNVEYEKQLSFKHSIVEDTLLHIAKLKNIETILQSVIGSPKQFYYRNKIELSFRPNKDGKMDLGFKEKGNWESLLPVESCHIFSEKLPQILIAVRKWLDEVESFEDGYLQYLVFRKSEKKDEYMLHIITQIGKLPKEELFVDLLKSHLGENFVCLYHTENEGGTGYVHHNNKKSTLLYGREYIQEYLGDLEFHISPLSFFQTNTIGTEVLYDVVKEYAELEDGGSLLDLYCGIGTIGQYVSKGAKDIKLFGIEIIPEAIEDANKSIKRNNISNCQYVCGDARKLLKTYNNQYQNLDVVVVDPPRAGLARKALQRSLDLKAKRFIYVSCNPATFARDVMYIHENSDYKIQKVQPVDMFPHTSHVECVGLFVC